MKLIPQQPPHIRHSDSNKSIMGDILIAMTGLFFMAAYFYGFRAIAIGLTAVSTCIAAQIFCDLLMGRELNMRDWSPIVTGMIIALMMPATISLKIVISVCMFAILIAKAPFGGTGENLFNPAAAGLAFGTLCWNTEMFSYPLPLHTLPMLINDTVKLAQNPAAVLKLGGIPSYTMSELLFGNVPGPMGATNILVIVACLIFLIARKSVKWYLPVSFISAVSIMAFLFPRASITRFGSVAFELFSGSLLFACVFMLSDPVTSPKRDIGRIFYGIAGGITAMCVRYFGVYAQGICFALLLVNALAPIFDQLCERIYAMKRRDL
ncbi:MAG: RnfABCDGE type electron transport complex subunit D, partial [Oscillospiraceae bacterium]